MWLLVYQKALQFLLRFTIICIRMTHHFLIVGKLNCFFRGLSWPIEKCGLTIVLHLNEPWLYSKRPRLLNNRLKGVVLINSNVYVGPRTRSLLVVNLIYWKAGFFRTIVPTFGGLSRSIFLAGFRFSFLSLINSLFNVSLLSRNKNKIIIARPERLKL